jgi:tetrahydromethanopterin S-methyltransferase subunit H
MWQFEIPQKIFEIGKIQLGGQPGELPTILIGSIFYDGHKIVEDQIRGIFKKATAERLLKKQEEMSERTGNPCMVDIVAMTQQAIQRYINFVAETTDVPLLIDSSSADVKIAGVKYCKEIGLIDRVIYNSISYHTSEAEVEILKDNDVKAAIILAYNPRNVWPIGRIEILKGDSSRKGLIKIAEEANIKKTLIDTAVLDTPSIGLAAEAIVLVKREFGLPCGAGPVNAVSEWKRVKEFGEHAKNVCIANAVTTIQYAGANFILYGPIEKSEVVFPAAAMTDAIIAYNARIHGVKTKRRDHPLFKIF